MSTRGATERREVRRARSGKRRRWLRAAVAGGLVLAVVAAGVVLQLYVAVTHRFDGRLWSVPSRIYSDVLVLERGDHAPGARIADRLERGGYARTEASPRSPGQFRLRSATLEVYVRGFETPAVRVESELVSLRLRGDRVVAIEASGRRRPRVVLEPELLATLYGPRQEERRIVALDRVPGRFVDAVLAAEDSRFHRHHGIDLRGIARAAWTNVRSAGIVQGGSTITQQTVKNLYLGHERTWSRKVRETLMALILDARYSKRRILEVYLNEVYLGQRGAVAVCGVQAAALFYFGRELDHLTLAESATLAGLIRSPGTYNPFRHPERARARRDQVLDALERLGLATGAEVAAAREEPLRLASGGGGFSHAPYAVDFVVSEVQDLYPRRLLEEQGLRIDTTIDTFLQESAEAALREGLERLERRVATVRDQLDERRLQGAILVTDPRSGALLAMVGGRDYRESQFNRSVQAHRQPGSCFKPFVYAAGFDRDGRGDEPALTPWTVLDDSPLSLVSGGRRWSPSNYDRQYRGAVTVRRALEDSLNVPTVRAAQWVGLERVVETARRCGIRSKLAPVPSLALGTEEVSPLELASAYGTLANGGRHVAPWILRAVSEGDGRPLGAGTAGGGEDVLDPRAAAMVNEILRGVMVRGTGKTAAALGYRGRAAGKTGTTDDTRDSWFVGYTDELLALVWIGYDDNARTGLTGSSGALPVWVDLMRRAADPGADLTLDAPRDLVDVAVCPDSRMRAVKACPTSVVERFVDGTQPRAGCPLHRGRLRRWVDKLLRREPEYRSPRGV